ncbi:hypothetical protein GOODEAATRI_010549 [Goodea atripinnis]|uniref:Uncharacterized protein n=1 Tax=Goodea atripinnis TaxID=208336 RepID=A0ABV0PMG9_9TELE
MLRALLVFSGGVMLVHDIRKNETRVIDFRETAPSAIHEDMLLNFNLNASLLRQMISDFQAFPVSHYTTSFTMEDGAAAAQVMVMGPDDHIVSVVRYVLLVTNNPQK